MILPVSNEIEINSSKKILWNLISSPEHLNLVHPFCKKNKIIKWDKNERKDILIYLNNLRYIREFHIWNENNGYSLFIGKENGERSKVEWKINSRKNKVFLKIKVYPYVFKNKNKIIYIFYYLFFIKPMLKKYLESVLKGINWYLRNKKPVPKNKFGKHSWFS
ncbi:MAG: hypothetical protein CMC33_04240 [Flavobacteriaceae bacterium]|nr:hypothetical protein [Flavobacteriaceae bacterium]|tara:strand:- start:1101 stop:1589 length:489 start_codon:yes stop_codon:yes gene_type:complete